MATFGTTRVNAWGWGDTSALMQVVASEGESVYFLVFYIKPEPEDLSAFPDWAADGPWVVPEGWTNAIDAEDGFAAYVSSEDPFFIWPYGMVRFAVFPYRYTGVGVPGDFTLNLLYRGESYDSKLAIGVTFGIALDEGETLGDFGYIGVRGVMPEGSIVMPGNAAVSGQRFVVVAEDYKEVGGY